MSYQDFKRRHPLGTTVDSDGVPKDAPIQCVDVPKVFLKEDYDVPYGSFGDAAEWATPNAALRAAMSKGGFLWSVTTTVKEGDIVPLRGLNGNKAGHIVLADGAQDGSRFLALEQNGSTGNGKGQGNDKIRLRDIPKDRILGVWRKESVASQSAPPTAAGNTTIRINGAPATQWNVRTSPDMGNNIVAAEMHAGKVANPNKVLGGQTYDTTILDGGWAKIQFRGMTVYVGPKAYTKV